MKVQLLHDVLYVICPFLYNADTNGLSLTDNIWFVTVSSECWEFVVIAWKWMLTYPPALLYWTVVEVQPKTAKNAICQWNNNEVETEHDL